MKYGTGAQPFNSGSAPAEPHLNSAAACVLCVGLDGRVQIANALAAITFGVTRDQLVGRRFADLLVTDDFDAHLMEDLAAGRLDEFQLDCRLRGADGELRRAMCMASSVRDEAGRPRHILVVLEDISRIKVAEAALRARLRDATTDLPTDLLMRDRLDVALAEHRETGRRMALLVVSLGVADPDVIELERLAGPAAKRIAIHVRASESLARIAADQFAVIMRDMARPGDAVGRAWNIVASLDDLAGSRGSVRAGVGIAICPNVGEDSESLLRHARLAMYRAMGGRSRVELFDTTRHRRPTVVASGPSKRLRPRLGPLGRGATRTLMKHPIALGAVAAALLLGAMAPNLESTAARAASLGDTLVGYAMSCQTVSECAATSIVDYISKAVPPGPARSLASEEGVTNPALVSVRPPRGWVPPQPVATIPQTPSSRATPVVKYAAATRAVAAPRPSARPTSVVRAAGASPAGAAPRPTIAPPVPASIPSQPANRRPTSPISTITPPPQPTPAAPAKAMATSSLPARPGTPLTPPPQPPRLAPAMALPTNSVPARPVTPVTPPPQPPHPAPATAMPTHAVPAKPVAALVPLGHTTVPPQGSGGPQDPDSDLGD